MKIIRIILPIAFCLLGNSVFAQVEPPKKEKPRRGYLAITFGPSVVTGDFASDSWYNDKAGFAKNGYQYSLLDFGFKFVPNFGLSAAIKGAVLPFNVQSLADGYAEEYGGQFTVKSSRWGYTGLFVGPFVSIPTKNVDVDFRFMTGLLFAVSPEITVSRDFQTLTQESGVGSGFGFNVGVGARVHLSKRFSALVQGEYHISRPTFQVSYYDNGNNSSAETGTFAQTYTMLNFSIGAAFRIF